MTTTVLDEQRLTILKHLASGKDLATVAAIVGLKRSDVLEIGNHHGYPSPEKLQKAVDLVAAKIDRARNTIPAGSPLPAGTHVTDDTAPPRPTRPATTSPSSVTDANARPVGAPDEIRVLLNAGKNHPAKRIQAQADRVLDALGRLRDLMAEDERKNAAKRAEDAQKVAAKAEIKRLEKALADARAKLRGKTPSGSTIDVGPDVSAADLRAWAKKHDIECPAVGRVPAAVREQYAAANPDEAA